jgi:hypothetical protein
VQPSPAASIDDDLRPGVAREPGLEITVESLLGWRDDDEVRARSSQIW